MGEFDHLFDRVTESKKRRIGQDKTRYRNEDGFYERQFYRGIEKDEDSFFR